MARIQYTVWSSYPPALTKYPQGYAKIHAGTVYKLMAGKVSLRIDQPLPSHTELSQITWVPPVKPPAPTPPKEIKVRGSRGATYVVKVYSDGRKECSCPGYSYRRFCKHTKEVA